MKNIALVGNPNSGKSTLFNALTGSKQFVGNWPGVTVEKKVGKTSISGETVNVVDLPGIYSISPYSKEEIITRDYILNENLDVVINIVDASNLERNLYLTTQIIELGVPVVVALNMMDVVKSKGEELSSKTLSKELGCEVCEISAITNMGIEELKEAVSNLSKASKKALHKFKYAQDVQEAIEKVKADISSNSNQKHLDFVALKILSEDQSVILSHLISQDVCDNASKAKKELEANYDDKFESIIADQRYAWINSIIDSVIIKKRKEKISLSNKIDRVLTNRILGLPIFFAIIYGIYFICLNPSGIGKKLVGITFGWVGSAMEWSSATLTNINVAPWLVSLISDGIVFGVGLVIAFIPYLMVLFACLAILEECGYMARVAFIMDRVFRKFGLSGKSFIPMLLGTGCSVQGIASSRTIENESDRKMTVFLTPFIPCATKMPVIILIVGLFTSSSFIAPLMYLLAILFIILGGIFLKNTIFKGEPAPFVMELPEYKIPRLKNIWHFIWDKTVSFFKKVSTIIFLSTVIIWALQYFTLDFHVAKVIDDSILASISKAISPIFVPLGFGIWQIIAAMITGFVAKDNVLATLGIIYGENITSSLSGLLSPASAVGLLLFFVFSSPCFASISAMKRELGGAKLTLKAVGFQMGTAYIVSFLAYQILNLIL